MVAVITNFVCINGPVHLVLYLWCYAYSPVRMVLCIWSCAYGPVRIVLCVWSCIYGAVRMVLYVWSSIHVLHFISDGCKKTAVVFEDVISTVDFVNCQSIQAQVSHTTNIVTPVIIDS